MVVQPRYNMSSQDVGFIIDLGLIEQDESNRTHYTVMYHSIRDEDWIRQEVIGCQKQPYGRSTAFPGGRAGSAAARAMSNKDG